MRIDAKGIPYKDLNEKIRETLNNGAREIILDNVNGQRYIGDGLRGSNIKIIINGIPGNDLAAFMDGPTIIVNSNAQDGIGNTMSAGKIIVYGDAGDIVGYSMRGGKIYIKGNVGYRLGIHMKAYQDLYPVIIIGGTARDFLGEYMAGGLLVILGIGHHGIGKKAHPRGIVGDFVGTGMHGGRIFIRGGVDATKLAKEVKTASPSDEDMKILEMHLQDFCRCFDLDLQRILKTQFTKLYPYTHRPYGKIYAY